MNVEAFVREMFQVDSTIRYIGIVDSEYRILVSQQREGIPSLTSDETTRNFVSIVPQIIVDSVEKLAPFLGHVGGMTVHYEKVLLVFYRIGNLIVMISFQPQVDTPFYNRITEAYSRLSARYLT